MGSVNLTCKCLFTFTHQFIFFLKGTWDILPVPPYALTSTPPATPPSHVTNRTGLSEFLLPVFLYLLSVDRWARLISVTLTNTHHYLPPFCPLRWAVRGSIFALCKRHPLFIDGSVCPCLSFCVSVCPCANTCVRLCTSIAHRSHFQYRSLFA